LAVINITTYLRYFVQFICPLLLLYVSTAGALDPERHLSQYNYKEWGVDEKLPQISVTSLAQDDKGYIWIGTQSGVARFNGKEFVSFNQANTSAFKSNLISDLIFDSNQMLWVLTGNGLAKLSSNGFIAIPEPSNLMVKPSKILEYHQQIIIASANGIFKLVDDKLEMLIPSSEAYSLATFNEQLIIGGRGQLTFFDNGKVILKELPKGFDKASVNDMRINRNDIWLATSKGLLVYRGGRFEQLKDIGHYGNEPAHSIYFDNNNLLWVATDIGIYRLNGDQLHNGSEILSYPRVSTFMQDKDNTIWLGTNDRGLFQLWDSWSVKYEQTHGINESLIWSVAGEQLSDLLVGTDKGVYKMEDDHFSSFINKSQLPDPSAYTLFIDNDQSIWVGTKGGIAHFNQDGSLIDTSYLDLLLGIQVNGIYRDSKDILWLVTLQGSYKIENESVVPIGIGSRYERESFRSVIEFEGDIFLGSQTGLFKFDGIGGYSSIDDSRLQTFITSFIKYKKYLIVGTYSQGLFIYSNEKWININQEDGLVFNDSFSLNLLEGSLWVSGFGGVYQLKLSELIDFVDEKQQKVYAEPILNDSGHVAGSQKAYCCNGAGHAKSTVIDGDIWLPTRSGVLKLEPSKVIKDQPLVDTVIEAIVIQQQYFDMYFYDQSVYGHNETVFDSKDISFKYIGLTGLDDGLVNYKHRLVGYSPTWINNGNNHEAIYTNLPHGKYVFEVMASNRNGLWPEEPTQLNFKVNARYHETIYFKILLFTAGLILLYGLYRLAIYRNKRKVALLERMVSEKTKELLISNNKLEEANNRLSVYSYTDPLTGVHNRRYFVKQIMSDIAHYVRNSSNDSTEDNIVLMLADIDFFKAINDQYGHNSGDEVLKQVVNSLSDNIRDGDYLIRWGGEEFLVALRPDHVSGVDEMCIRLLKKVNSHTYQGANGESIDLTISVGFCFYPMVKQVVDNWSWEDALEIADKALYQAKTHGRNQWVGYQLLPNVIDDFSDQNRHKLNDTWFQRFSGNASS